MEDPDTALRAIDNQSRESALQLLGWHPFDIVSPNYGDGPIGYALFALAALSMAGFVWESRRTPKPYFSLRFFLALVPFITGSALMFLRIYGGIVIIAYYGTTFCHPDEYPFPTLYRLALSAFQCGLLVSGILILIHTIIYAFHSKRRDS